MVNWVDMIASGLACQNVAMFIGLPWMLWLISLLMCRLLSIQSPWHHISIALDMPSLYTTVSVTLTLNSLAESSSLVEDKH